MKSIVTIATFLIFVVIILMAESLGLMSLVWAGLGGILLGGFCFVVVTALLMFLKATNPGEQQNQRPPTRPQQRQAPPPEPKNKPAWLQLLHLLDHLRKQS